MRLFRPRRRPGPDESALQKAEDDLAAETQASLVWEAYRIASNGLPFGDLRSHLAARKARFDRALREEAMSAIG